MITGKHALQDFIQLLPETDLASIRLDTAGATDPLNAAPTGPHHLMTSPTQFPPATQRSLMIESACAAIKELVASSEDNATALHTLGGVPRLIALNLNNGNRLVCYMINGL